MSKPAARKTAPRIPRISPEPYSRQEFENDQMGQTGNDISEKWQLRCALEDLLDLYDRHVHGKTKSGKSSESWGVNEVLRLNEIRALAGVK